MNTIDKKRKWDRRFLELADHISQWSKDPSGKVGAVIANGKQIVSMGYNGFPMGVRDSTEFLSNRKEKYPRTIHAEKNAILFAKQHVNGFTIYCTHHPCSQCAAMIIQSGVSKVVCYAPDEDFLSRWSKDIEIARSMFSDVNTAIIQYKREDDD